MNTYSVRHIDRMTRFNERKHQRSHNRHTLRVVTIAAGLIIALGYAGHIDYQSALVEQASGYCQTANLDYSTTPTLAQCIDNQLERNK